MGNKLDMKLSVPAFTAASLLALLSGCASGFTFGSSGNDERGMTPEETAEPIEIVAWDEPSPDDISKPIVERMFARFEELHPNIKVQHVDANQTSDREKFLTSVAGGEQPDISRAAFPDIMVYMERGMAADITDLVDAFPQKNDFVDGSFDLVNRNGRIFGIPYEIYWTGLFYNKKLFSQAGIEGPPDTWDKFADAAERSMAANPGTTGFDILGMDWADWHFEYYVWQAGGDLTEKLSDGTVKLLFTSEPVKKALQYYKDLKWKRMVVQKNVVQDINENNKDFYTEKTAMILGSSYGFGEFLSKGMPAEDIGFAPFPKGPADVAPSQIGGSYWMFNPHASPEQLKAAVEYAMFFMSKEASDMYASWALEKGIVMHPLSVLKRANSSEYTGGLPDDYVKAVRGAVKDSRPEYFLKAVLSPYLVKAIQQVLLDPQADPLTELKKAQSAAQREVVDKYNADVRGGMR
ncbi:ABC-type glycerol-3-phosphate transport system substrate-binding protein [Paenibacillus taihuensis]|uniref:ABC-type glycerol-3-phosphate transport system substrate-binding protein n=1 Tax=Paenibacillus taihuensis TaxID=1156355 RepID=A0A3D9SI70_9BACL|nr:extracellular solute-binding protein [Paenibacillus taihuensis]REE91578.1 ABC-type glycerol-3-phosphate transport system substrate-binding protein [Paenibacillus taihuensis]